MATHKGIACSRNCGWSAHHASRSGHTAPEVRAFQEEVGELVLEENYQVRV